MDARKITRGRCAEIERDKREENHGSMPEGHHPRARGVASDVAAAHLFATCAARAHAADRSTVSERGSWHFGGYQALTAGVENGSAGAQAHVLGKFAPPVPERCSRARGSPRSSPVGVSACRTGRPKDLRSAHRARGDRHRTNTRAPVSTDLRASGISTHRASVSVMRDHAPGCPPMTPVLVQAYIFLNTWMVALIITFIVLAVDTANHCVWINGVCFDRPQGGYAK